MGNANICVANDISACISVSVCPHLLKEQFSLKSKLNEKKCLQKYKEFSLVSVLFYLGHELRKQKNPTLFALKICGCKSPGELHYQR